MHTTKKRLKVQNRGGLKQCKVHSEDFDIKDLEGRVVELGVKGQIVVDVEKATNASIRNGFGISVCGDELVALKASEDPGELPVGPGEVFLVNQSDYYPHKCYFVCRAAEVLAEPPRLTDWETWALVAQPLFYGDPRMN